MGTFIKIAAPVAVMVLAIGSIASLKAAKEAPAKAVEAPRPTALHVAPVTSERINLKVQSQGEVRPRTEIDLVPEISGKITYIDPAFEAGGAFEAGATLLQIDDADYRLSVTSAEARVAEAQVKLERELADARIKRQQWDDWVKGGEPTPLALNKPQVAEAQAKLRAAEAELAKAKINLERTTIKSPFKGRVRERMAGLGQYVNTGVKLGRIFATDVVEVQLPLTDKELSELGIPIGFIANDMNAPEVILQANVGNTAQSWQGHIVRTHAAIDDQTRLIYAVVQVEKPYEKDTSPLAVGLFVSARIESAKTTTALTMPRVALRNEDTVYVVSSENKLEIRKVDMLSTSPERLYVISGVKAGENVVTSALPIATEGMTVMPITATALSADTTAN